MERGKKICNALKEIRKRIADANDIPYESEECRYIGECIGSCPKCDEEAQYIKEHLDERAGCDLPVNADTIITDEELEDMIEKPAQSELQDDLERGAMLTGECNPSDFYTLPSKIMKEMLEENKYLNVVFSPVGIAYILAMLQNGMELGDEYVKIERLIGSFFFLMKNEWTKGFRLSHALSLWHKGQGKLRGKYIKDIKDLYDADVYTADFSNVEHITSYINKWVDSKTCGKIKTLNTGINPAMAMLFIDALYLKAAWEEPFDEDLTKRMAFYNADGSKSIVNMMYQCLRNPLYIDNDEFQAILLPYCGGRYGMSIVKPKASVKLDKVMTNEIEKWGSIWQCSTINTDVDLYLPRIKIDNHLKLTNTLKKMGMKDLFQRQDLFPYMTDAPVTISDIVQQCNIDINEEGTEAAAVTHATMLGCLPLNETRKCYQMKLDRPFGFAIVDFFGKPLFMGVIKTLTDKGKEKKRKVSNRKIKNDILC